MDTVRELREKVEQERAAYAGDEPRPIGSYAALLATYGASVGVLGALVRKRGRPLPERPSASDLALIAVATHKISRMVTKDTVLAAVRAPFTRFKEPAGGGEVNEEPRGEGGRHAVGELLTCPFCFGQWVATGFVFGLLLAPRATRQVAAVFSTVAASDALQYAWSALERVER